MKAELVYWHKARLQERYILEMQIHKIAKSTRYPDGIKYGLILVDSKTGKQILMDNHHPKGPHAHVNGKEIPYQFVDEEKLIRDFREMILTYMEVRI